MATAAAPPAGASVITALSHVVVPVGPEQLAPAVRFYTDVLQFEQYLEATPGIGPRWPGGGWHMPGC